ncbi:hypothetical protein QWY14_02080 [Planococcus sp. N028]|uniref:Uncharacterized protein n=1 Tax=Planococcus shixiaomingii TaxID=3058393 RepID=A0ABT8MY32_9BACL|nr:hypothetical protein [Planococcus sp. N028]MDN7240555.1 hypothetical protein [Planococcus sp. N028]
MDQRQLGHFFATKQRSDAGAQGFKADWRSGAFCRTAGLTYDPKS